MKRSLFKHTIVFAALCLLGTTAWAQRSGGAISGPTQKKQSETNSNPQPQPKPQPAKAVNYDTYNTQLVGKADSGDVKAQYSLGMIYANGWGINKDEATAVKWFKKAAEKEDPNALYQLGLYYEKGNIVPKDEALALEYYEKAMLKGVEEAQSRIDSIKDGKKGKNKTSPSQQPVQQDAEEMLNPEFAPKNMEDIPYELRNLINNMVVIQGGDYVMEKPETKQQVTVKSFSICKYEVTQEEWRIVMGNNPSQFKGEKLPVEQVSWNDCIEFIQRLNKMTGYNFRLLTEEEWVYAASGGNESKGYEFSGSNSVENVAWYNPNDPLVEGGQVSIQGLKTHNVGSKLPNELGLYDMSGNVFEWCQNSSEGSRVIKGGCWASLSKTCSVSYRNTESPTTRNAVIGLRLARSL